MEGDLICPHCMFGKRHPKNHLYCWHCYHQRAMGKYRDPDCFHCKHTPPLEK